MIGLLLALGVEKEEVISEEAFKKILKNNDNLNLTATQQEVLRRSLQRIESGASTIAPGFREEEGKQLKKLMEDKEIGLNKHAAKVFLNALKENWGTVLSVSDRPWSSVKAWMGTLLTVCEV